ncbi:MAG: D-galactonate dehydratase family protein [Abditibacteriales bacterium]|nr:D-galactonate dehydratase family protein [Abditibacteriales bacterium]MDW8364424.1 D-galactonate dehydratase family protein [Abditibacteriales bacterium]
MRITDIRVFVTCPTGQNYVVTKVLTDEGVYGVGEGTLNGNEIVVARCLEHIKELLIGQDPRNSEDLWWLIYRSGYWRQGPIFRSAQSAIDFALWDIKGKIANLPVYQLLGGASRKGVKVYRHAGGRDPKEVEDSVRAYLEQGAKVVRCQIGGYGGSGVLAHEPPQREGLPSTVIFEPAKYLVETPKLFEHLRNALGMEVELCHDVHEQLTPTEAAWLAKQLEPYRLFFLEDPIQPEDLEGLRLIRQHATTHLALGELITEREQCLALFRERLIDYIRIAPLHVGGITEARKIMTLAEPFSVKSAFHGAGDLGPIAQAAAIHLQMVIPNFGVQEWSDFRSREVLCELFPTPCELRDGYAYPNDAPGLGIDFNEELALKFPYKPGYLPIFRRQDGTMHRY